MFFKNIETERLYLKVVDRSDAEFMLRQFSDADVTRYLFDEEPFTSLEQATELIDFFNEDEPRNQNRWIIINKATGERMGTAGFHCWNRGNGTCELGYDLYPTYRKQGFMRETLKALLAFAENDMKIKTVEAHIYVDNESSLKTASAAGFVNSNKTYYEHFRGKDYPHYIYVREF